MYHTVMIIELSRPACHCPSTNSRTTLSGVSCASADQVLGNYYDTSELSVDPWTLGANYSTDAHGDVKGFFHLSSGFNYAENIGHAVVFYDRDGSSISCGTLMTRDMMLMSDNIDIFPGYTGGFEPVGSVKVNFLQNETMLFSYDMAGLPSDCVECGVHIHSGEYSRYTHSLRCHAKN